MNISAVDVPQSFKLNKITPIKVQFELARYNQIEAEITMLENEMKSVRIVGIAPMVSWICIMRCGV